MLDDAQRVDPEISNLHFSGERDSILEGPWERVVENPLLVFLEGVRCEFCGQESRVAPAVTERQVFPMQPTRFQNLDGITSGLV